MNKMDRRVPQPGEAVLDYGDAEFRILRPGAYVRCAVTGERIELADLRYWSVELQEAYATTEVSIAKLGATEAAQRVIDRAVQLFGGRGVMAGAVVEQLYRAIRPLRIYEGTSEIQRMIIGKAVAATARAR